MSVLLLHVLRCLIVLECKQAVREVKAFPFALAPFLKTLLVIGNRLISTNLWPDCNKIQFSVLQAGSGGEE